MTAGDYKERFEKWQREGTKAENSKTGEQIALDGGEKFVQAYAPGIAGRKELPEYWFISDRGNVISAYFNAPKWLTKEKINKKYSRYHKAGKVYALHNLIGIVFNSYATQEARQEINERGFHAFGTKPGDVQGHHIDGNPDNNRPDNIEFLIRKDHDILTRGVNHVGNGNLDTPEARREVQNIPVPEHGNFKVIFTGLTATRDNPEELSPGGDRAIIDG